MPGHRYRGGSPARLLGTIQWQKGRCMSLFTFAVLLGRRIAVRCH